jgi:hypothetical protein
MRHRSFGDFVDKKKRDSIRQLKLIKKMLESKGMKAESYLETDQFSDPYVFCYNPTKKGSFDGVRIYKIGNDIAFRVQKESKTHPYGSAYPIPVETMYYDFLSDKNSDEKKAGKKVIDSVSSEILNFFNKSNEIENHDRSSKFDDDANGNILVRSTGTDYSSLVYNKM